MSIASQSTQQKFPFPYDDVFDGVVAAIPDIGFSMKSHDRLIGRVTASTGMSLFSWGENVTIIIEKIDERSTLVGIESALKVGMNVAGVHRHAKNFDRLIESVSSCLRTKKQRPAPAEAVPKPVPPPPAPAPEKSAADLSIPCPLCGRQLRVSTLKQGENWCPHCFEKFIAE
jgi:hypothetical protein